jgi:hypothetical protein
MKIGVYSNNEKTRIYNIHIIIVNLKSKVKVEREFLIQNQKLNPFTLTILFEEENLFVKIHF